MTDVPDSSAVRTALWRALHAEVDADPPLLDDRIGLALADPPDGWRDRPDMQRHTQDFRTAVAARTRFVEDLLLDGGIGQYVLLGAGLDTFALRHRDTAGPVVFEIDAPATQAWKAARIDDLGLAGDRLRFVPVDFESDADWWAALVDAGFDPDQPAVVSSSGVSMYISVDATRATLHRLAHLVPGSVVAMTFMLPVELADPADRPGLEGAARGARASGTPWVSFFTPEEITGLARDAGFAEVTWSATAEVAAPYLAGRDDGLRAASGEGLLLART